MIELIIDRTEINFTRYNIVYVYNHRINFFINYKSFYFKAFISSNIVYILLKC